MANTWGHRLRLSIFGESHGKAIGVTVDGLPSGTTIDLEEVGREMQRRAPGQNAWSTPRKEGDQVEVLSGMKDGVTTGAPLCGVIFNSDARSRDYDQKLRPGHADMTALLKYGGHADMRGGGHFSGRLTAPLVFAGALAKQVLACHGVRVHGRIAAIAGIQDPTVITDPERYEQVSRASFPAADEGAAKEMQEAISLAHKAGDSVGGVAEVVAFGVPAGLGEPFFRSAESEIAAMLFSVPAIKGVEFGDGFAAATRRGSENNDPIVAEQRSLRTATNHSGGILGGITTGMPLIVRVAFKPTPSISMEQDTVDGGTMEPAKLQIRGRHDPCIVPRAVPVVEAALALVLLDLLLERGGEGL